MTAVARRLQDSEDGMPQAGKKPKPPIGLQRQQSGECGKKA